ncbi:alpha/beta hydrolase fold-domain-containing protein [Podospora appendiculata]|uniref:Alpha/beta hydrolase fold-domain-containing protein n=1 Tax=Podospora appendiculata TaxID=314037 RepID=A0AAE1CE39_9PEZI|nr:alpha/beta hydrolase fold-domain-containing protein [Podospora appendiculata]
MSNLALDPDFARVLALLPAPPPQPTTALSLRAQITAGFNPILTSYTVPPSVTETIIHIPIPASPGTTIALHRLTPTTPTSSSPTAAVVYAHGGGMIAGAAAHARPALVPLVLATSATFYSVEYRLAPEHPFPTPVEDVYTALEWVRDHAADQNIDPARIALVGDSAGGGLAAGAALMTRDRHFAPPVAKLVLIYPMLDDRTSIAADHPLAAQPMIWTDASNKLAWAAYLGDEDRTRGHVSPYAAPARAGSFAGLPRTYIDCGGLDLFRDENLAFAAGLAAANVEVEVHLYPGVGHGFDFLAPGTPVARAAAENRLWALKRL